MQAGIVVKIMEVVNCSSASGRYRIPYRVAIRGAATGVQFSMFILRGDNYHWQSPQWLAVPLPRAN